MANVRKCSWVRELKCYGPQAIKLDQCEFCLKMRRSYIAELKPLAEDYAHNIAELNRLRREHDAHL
jgi:hypothetical protein